MSENNSSSQRTGDETEAEEMAQQLRDDVEKSRRFGSYSIIYEQFNKQQCEEFLNSNLAETINSLIPKLPMTKILTLMERHPEILYVFLQFFENINPKQHQAISYISHVIHAIPRLPIRWIYTFTLNLDNVRYSHLFLSSTFQSYINAKPHILHQVRQNKDTWRKMYPNPTTRGPDYLSSWQILMKLREQCRELVEYKFDYKLSEYSSIDKEDFVLKIIHQCDKPLKLSRVLKTQIVPFCEINDLNIEKLIVAGVCKRQWEVKSKLNLITEFVKTPSMKTLALEKMQFSGESEFDEIHNYAKQHNLHYVPDPDIYSKCINAQFTVQRSESHMNLYSSLPEKMIIPKKSAHSTIYKRSPSIDLSLSSFASLSHFSSIADGNPDNPEEYAAKLKKFRNLKEIRPIYDLASTYDIVISYDGYSDLWTRQEIFYKLISRNGWDDLETISQVLALSTIEIIDIISHNHNYLQHGQEILPRILQYINRANSNIFYQFTEDCMIESVVFTPLIDLVDIWHSCLQKVFTLIKYDLVDNILILSRLLTIYKKNPDKLIQNIILDSIKTGKNCQEIYDEFIQNNLEKAASQLIPDPETYDVDQFVSDYTSGDIDRVSYASCICRRFDDPEKAKSYLSLAILELEGSQYSLLAHTYSMLKELGADADHYLSILSALFDGPKHNIKFHELLSNPLKTLQSNVNVDSLNGLLPVAKLMNISNDELIVYVMINKMTSPYIDDYRDLIYMLEEKTHKELLTELAPRLNKEDLSLFYQAIGMIDQQLMTQTAMDLNKNGLSEFAQHDLMSDPCKLIKDIYSKTSLYESHGRRLHKITERIARRFSVDPRTLKMSLLNEWLDEEYPQLPEHDETAIYGMTNNEILFNADNESVAKCLFLLRGFTARDALDLLSKHINDKNKPREMCRSILCMFGIANEEGITAVVRNAAELDELYTRALLCAHARKLSGYDFSVDDFFDYNIDEKLKDYIDEPWALLSRAIVCINDDQKLIEIFPKLWKVRKLELLNLVPQIYNRQIITNPAVFDSILHAISCSVEDLIKREKHAKPFKGRQQAIFKKVLECVSLIPPFDSLYIDNEKVLVPNVIVMLTNNGNSSVAGELGSRISDLKTRVLTMHSLIDADHFDIALSVGFDTTKVFDYITTHKVIKATHTMIDENFTKYTTWLYINDKKEALGIVEKALADQGRTREIQRMHKRFEEIEMRRSQPRINI